MNYLCGMTAFEEISVCLAHGVTRGGNVIIAAAGILPSDDRSCRPIAASFQADESASVLESDVGYLLATTTDNEKLPG